MELKDHILQFLKSNPSSTPEYHIKEFTHIKLIDPPHFSMATLDLGIILSLDPRYPSDHPVWNHAALMLKIDWQKILYQRQYEAEEAAMKEIKRQGCRNSSPGTAMQVFRHEKLITNHEMHWRILNRPDEFSQWLTERIALCGIYIDGSVAFETLLRN